MAGQILHCTYCGAPLVLTALGIRAWRVGNEFVCNEYCADGITPPDNNFRETALAVDLQSK